MKTYLILTPYNTFNEKNNMDQHELKILLNKHNYKEVSYKDVLDKKYNHIDFIYYNVSLNKHYDKSIFSISSVLYTRFLNYILDKDTLYNEFQDIIKNNKEFHKKDIINYANQLTDKSVNIHDIKSYNDLKQIYKTDTFIIKPSKGFKGLGISIVTNNNDLQQYKECIKTKLKSCNIIKYNDKNKNFLLKILNNTINIYPYYKDIILFDNKKFHVRLYLLIKYTPKNNGIYYSYFDMLKIMTAKDPYKKSDYTNENIHDTHFNSTDNDYYLFIDDYKENNKYNSKHINISEDNFNSLNLQIKILSYLVYLIFVKMIKNKILYKDDHAQNIVEIFGLDLLITDKYQIKVLEINNKLGYAVKNQNNKIVKLFNKRFFQWYFDNIEDII